MATVKFVYSAEQAKACGIRKVLVNGRWIEYTERFDNQKALSKFPDAKTVHMGTGKEPVK